MKINNKITIYLNEFAYYIKQLVYSIALFAIFIPASDMRKTYSDFPHSMGVLLLITISIVFFLRNTARDKWKIQFTSLDIILYSICIMLIGSLLISCLMQKLDFSAYVYYLLMFAVYFFIISRGDISYLNIAVGAILLNVYIVFRCLTEIGVSFIYYEGTVTNVNQFAIVLLGGAIGSLYVVTYCKKISRVLGIITLLVSFVFIIFTSSRTSILAFVLSSVLGLGLYMKYDKNISLIKKNIINKSQSIILGAFLIVFVCVLVHYRIAIIDYIFDKWKNGRSSELFSGRSIIWKNIWCQNAFWGNYRNALNANSDYIDWLEKYGYIPFFLYLAMWLYILVISIRTYIKDKNPETLFCLMTISCYMLCSLFENMITFWGKSINVMTFCSIGIVFRHGRKLRCEELT